VPHALDPGRAMWPGRHRLERNEPDGDALVGERGLAIRHPPPPAAV